MNTQTAERIDTAEDIAPAQNAVAILSQPRLPYHDAIKERFGIDKGGWKVLCEATFPAAKTFDAIVLALTYCRARNLDVFKRPVHIVPMWNSALGRTVETVWPGIAELRTTAFRTKQYVGCDEAVFGPTVKRTFAGKIEKWANRQKTTVDEKIDLEYPEWCQITMYRELGGRVCKFVSPKVYWLESYASIGRSIIPNEMWQERPWGQIEKCTEAAGLRRTFPEELGNDLTAEEMHGRTFAEPPVAAAPIGSPGGPPDPDAKNMTATEVRERMAAPIDVGQSERGGPPAVSDEDDDSAIDGAQWLKDLEGSLGGCEEFADLWAKQEKMMKPMKGRIAAETWTAAEALVKKHVERLGNAATESNTNLASG